MIITMSHPKKMRGIIVITKRELFCVIFGAITLDPRLPYNAKKEMSEMVGIHFGIPKEEIKELLLELDKTLIYTMKDLADNGFVFDRKMEKGV